MIRVIELVGNVLAIAAYLGLVLAVFVNWHQTRSKELTVSILGILLIEIGRAIRIFGPGFSVEPGSGGLRLTDDSSAAVFLGNVLLMPIGYCIAAAGIAMFLWNYRNAQANAL